MADDGLIEAYLDQLRHRLRRSEDVDDVLAEVEDHLREVVDSHVRCGMAPHTAELHALGQFGSAALVSRAFVSSRKAGTAMATPVTRFTGLAAMIGGLFTIVVFGLASVSELDVGGTSTWFAPVATTAVLLSLSGVVGLHLRHRAVYSRKGRIGRWLVPLGVLGFLASALAWFVPGGIVAQVVIGAGLFLVGADVWEAGVVDRRALLLAAISIPLVFTVALFGAGRFDWSTVASIFGFAGVGSAFTWCGYSLWRERAHGTGSAPTATA